MGKFWGIWGEDFSTVQKSSRHFGENFGEDLGNFVSKFASFFGNFIQQKGDANLLSLDVSLRNHRLIVKAYRGGGWLDHAFLETNSLDGRHKFIFL